MPREAVLLHAWSITQLGRPHTGMHGPRCLRCRALQLSVLRAAGCAGAALHDLREGAQHVRGRELPAQRLVAARARPVPPAARGGGGRRGGGGGGRGGDDTDTLYKMYIVYISHIYIYIYLSLSTYKCLQTIASLCLLISMIDLNVKTCQVLLLDTSILLTFLQCYYKIFIIQTIQYNSVVLIFVACAAQTGGGGRGGGGGGAAARAQAAAAGARALRPAVRRAGPAHRAVGRLRSACQRRCCCHGEC